MSKSDLDPIKMLRPRRKIAGASAILLPFDGDGAVDWRGFEDHARRTADVGLTPAVNMDTGYANLIDEDLRVEVLRRTRNVLDGRPFLAGAFVGDRRGDAFDLDAYLRQAEAIQAHGGTPVIFQSHGLTSLDDDGIVEAYAEIGRQFDRFVAFELGTAFAPVRPDLFARRVPGTARHPVVRRGQAFLAPPRARMASPDRARPAPARLPGLHRQRPGDRHGHVRQRLPARPEHVRPRPLRPRATRSGRRATPLSTSSTTCSSTSASSPSGRRSRPTSIRRRCSSVCGAGSPATGRTRTARPGPQATSKSCATSPGGSGSSPRVDR